MVQTFWLPYKTKPDQFGRAGYLSVVALQALHLYNIVGLQISC